MKKNKRLRLIIDTNIWISYLISVPFRHRCRLFLRSDYQQVCSETLFNEITQTIRKLKIRKRIEITDEKDFLQTLWQNSEMINVCSTIELCRDPKDNFLLALAKDGNADYLITGDKDLLILKQFGKTKIINVAEFEQLLNHKETII
jgi:putative PIN family toxin of toxin-antitoxin system